VVVEEEVHGVGKTPLLLFKAGVPRSRLLPLLSRTAVEMVSPLVLQLRVLTHADGQMAGAHLPTMTSLRLQLPTKAELVSPPSLPPYLLLTDSRRLGNS
jgi:hypothetical protein